MSINKADVVADKQIRLLDGLQSLLEEQIEMVQHGDIDGIEALSKQTNSLVGKCVQSGILERADFESQREKLKKLYEQLSLALSDQKTETGEQLSRIRRGKKTIAAYRGNI